MNAPPPDGQALNPPAAAVLRQSTPGAIAMWIFVVLPFGALLAAIPVAWGSAISILDLSMAVIAYIISGFGVTIGFHRYLTHGSFRAHRALRILLAVAGCLSVQGTPSQWVANHRRHHAFSDRDGDPHSPWRYGSSIAAVMKGLAHAHVGWMFRRELSNRAKFAPDLVADQDIRFVDRLFGPLVAVSLLSPAAVGGLLTGTWWGAFTGFLWAGLVRMAVLHHITWSVNSICHVLGARPFVTRDKATNFWPLAILSFGESWHNSHHADPTGARHGVLRGQIDPSARLIWMFEKFGWVSNVRWPQPDRLATKRLSFAAANRR
jgi:stearoyl-CoA desaturase (Delta-9 desaturase)